MDLGDLFTGRMSWRRFRVIWERLPPESAAKTQLRNATDLSELPPPKPGHYGAWSQAELLLARLIDSVDHLAWMQSDGSKPPPKPYPRPGVATVTPISKEALAYLEYVRAHQGEAPPEGWKPQVV